MKRKLNFITGLILGVAILLTTGAAASTAIQAVRSSQTIYFNGKQVNWTAYNVADQNYVRLADICEAMGVGLRWDAKTNSVHITTPDDAASAESKAVHSSVVDVIGSGYGQAEASPNPQVGDKITCKDGYVYEIKDLRKYGNSMFASEPTGALPTPTCDWSLLVQPELPDPEARHFTSGGKEYLFVRNLYETRRMQYTLYNAIGANPQTWKNGKPATMANGDPLVRINLSIPDDVNAYSFWPWRSNQITDLFNSCPPGEYSVEAWDLYCDGAFRYTEYYISVK